MNNDFPGTSLILGIGVDHSIGNAGASPLWQHTSQQIELVRFLTGSSKEKGVVVIGENAWSLAKEADHDLPWDCPTIVLSQNRKFTLEKSEGKVARSLAGVKKLAGKDRRIWVVGGYETFVSFLPHATMLYVNIYPVSLGGDLKFIPSALHWNQSGAGNMFAEYGTKTLTFARNSI